MPQQQQHQQQQRLLQPQQPAQPPPQQLQTQQPADPRVKRFMARVRLALLDSCQAAVLVHQQLVQDRVVSSKESPKFPLEKLQEAFAARWACLCAAQHTAVRITHANGV